MTTNVFDPYDHKRRLSWQHEGDSSTGDLPPLHPLDTLIRYYIHEVPGKWRVRLEGLKSTVLEDVATRVDAIDMAEEHYNSRCW